MVSGGQDVHGPGRGRPNPASFGRGAASEGTFGRPRSPPRAQGRRPARGQRAWISDLGVRPRGVASRLPRPGPGNVCLRNRVGPGPGRGSMRIATRYRPGTRRFPMTSPPKFHTTAGYRRATTSPHLPPSPLRASSWGRPPGLAPEYRLPARPPGAHDSSGVVRGRPRRSPGRRRTPGGTAGSTMRIGRHDRRRHRRACAERRSAGWGPAPEEPQAAPKLGSPTRGPMAGSPGEGRASRRAPHAHLGAPARWRRPAGGFTGRVIGISVAGGSAVLERFDYTAGLALPN